MSASRSVQIIPKTHGKEALSHAQSQFNGLIKKIDQQKKKLEEWKNIEPIYLQKVDSEYAPLVIVFQEQRSALVQLLDKAYDLPIFKKTDKSKISHLICEMSEHLIGEFGMDFLKPIFDKYSPSAYDSDNQCDALAFEEGIREMAKEMFGIEIGDDVDVSTPEKFDAFMDAEMARQQSGQTEGQGKPTKKQKQKEAHKQEADALASKSVQEIYRKLAAALHPDREQDADERDRKAELMKRVNIAYAKKDLLALLNLQLEIEQIDPEHISNIADDRLRHFNRILTGQMGELAEELAQVEGFFKMRLGMPFHVSLAPKQIINALSSDIKILKADISRIKRELENFKDPVKIKAWIKAYQRCP